MKIDDVEALDWDDIPNSKRENSNNNRTGGTGVTEKLYRQKHSSKTSITTINKLGKEEDADHDVITKSKFANQSKFIKIPNRNNSKGNTPRGRIPIVITDRSSEINSSENSAEVKDNFYSPEIQIREELMSPVKDHFSLSPNKKTDPLKKNRRMSLLGEHKLSNLKKYERRT